MQYTYDVFLLHNIHNKTFMHYNYFLKTLYNVKNVYLYNV